MLKTLLTGKIIKNLSIKNRNLLICQDNFLFKFFAFRTLTFSKNQFIYAHFSFVDNGFFISLLRKKEEKIILVRQQKLFKK